MITCRPPIACTHVPLSSRHVTGAKYVESASGRLVYLDKLSQMKRKGLAARLLSLPGQKVGGIFHDVVEARLTLLMYLTVTRTEALDAHIISRFHRRSWLTHEDPVHSAHRCGGIYKTETVCS